MKEARKEERKAGRNDRRMCSPAEVILDPDPTRQGEISQQVSGQSRNTDLPRVVQPRRRICTCEGHLRSDMYRSAAKVTRHFWPPRRFAGDSDSPLLASTTFRWRFRLATYGRHDFQCFMSKWLSEAPPFRNHCYSGQNKAKPKLKICDSGKNQSEANFETRQLRPE